MRIKPVILGLTALAAGCSALAFAFAGDSAPDAQGIRGADQVSSVQTSQVETDRRYLSPQEMELAVANRLLPAGVKSLLPVEKTLRHGDFVWDESQAPDKGPLTIHIDLRRQLVSVFRKGHEIGTAVIVYGAPDMDTPEGRFKVISRHRDYVSRKYDAPMPYSLFFTNDGVALHASKMTERHATHGCVGLPEDFARHLFDASSKGDVVEVVRSVEPVF